jgi:two-component system nitrogen regulation response regulator NtrX
MHSILIVDDEAGIRDSLAGILTDEGYTATSAGSGEACLDLLRRVAFDVVLLDIWLPGADGLETLQKIRDGENPPEVIMISGHGTIETAVRATKLGAYDFLEKPLSIEKTLIVVKNAIDSKKLRRENVDLKRQLQPRSMIVGESIPMKALRQQIGLMAPTNGRVLIYGESGSGKELVAHAIHAQSLRKDETFVEVNCAAIPEDLIESELFGHFKGSFPGAASNKEGKFQRAHGGTLFLDEVGELPSETQIALLRVLQEHEFERVGGIRRVRVDVRVITATNRDLQSAIAAGCFRNDLFYRLNVFPIEIPSLRERRADIPLLAEYFIERYARKTGKKIKRVNKQTLELLQSYPWPGNIRELQNVIERSVILCETEIFSIDESWLPQQPLAAEPKPQIELPRRLLVQEKNMIEAALKETRGRVSGPAGAALKLGIPRSTLESKIRSLKINKNRFRLSPGT